LDKSINGCGAGSHDPCRHRRRRKPFELRRGNWQNYIDITIKENSGGNLTDYQIPVLLSGGNFPPDERSDGADIRFIDAGEDELNYWIEKWDYENRVARIWVKVSRLNANSEGHIRMYYGNPSATSASNGEGTFEFFDDFGGTGIDQTKWHINYGTPVVSDGILSLSGETIVSERTRAFGYWARVHKYVQPGPSVNVELQPTPQSPCKSSASVSLIGEKTNVELGEDILLKLSAVNLITNPMMHVQVILLPPSGMSVSSSEFVVSGTGQYTSTFNMEPGMGRDIEVRIRSNQAGHRWTRPPEA
jgi:hypothetical protein